MNALNKIADGSFAEACYDTNTIAELEETLAGDVDKIDCHNWGLSDDEWREQIALALAALKENEVE